MKSWMRAEGLILLIALAVRLVHLAGIIDDPLADTPRMDPRYHDEWARAIAGGDLTFDGPYFRAPLYAHLLGGLYAISGGSIAFARAFQLALGLGTVMLVIRIGRRTVGERAALIGGAAWGVYPLALRIEGDLLVEGPFLLLAMAALLQVLRALARPTRRAWFLTGLLFGLAAITRPNILAYAVMLPIVTALARSRWGRRGPGVASEPGPRVMGRVTEVVILAFGIILPIVPVSLHNAIAGHDFTPIATQAGVNFYIGNNPRSDGFTAILPGTRATWWGGHDDSVELAERARKRPLRPTEVSDYWLEQGLAFIAEEPGAAFRLFVRKLYLFWWGGEISNNEHIYFLRRYSWPLKLSLGHWGIYFPFGLVGPIALAGMVLAWKRFGRRIIPLLAYVALYMVSVVLFFVCARFRLPVVPVLLLFAAVAGIDLVRRARRGWRELAPVGLPVLALVLVFNIDPYGIRPAILGSQSLSYFDLGVYYAVNGKTAEAEELLRRAAELDPGHPGPHAWLGRIALERGEMEEAEAELRLATRGDPVLFRDVVTQAQRDLGRLAMRNGWPGRALAVYRAALEVNPRDAAAAAGAGVAAIALGDTATAFGYLRHALELDPRNQTARAALAGLR